MKRNPLIIILEDIRSALNVGAIFRTADAVDAEKLILAGITPYPPHPKIPKTALGAVESVPWEYSKHIKYEISKLRSRGYVIYSVEINDRSRIIYDIDFPKKTVLIFGNEINGVSIDTMELSDSIVHLPMYGVKESLNVATTVGITCYEIIRQWKFKC